MARTTIRVSKLPTTGVDDFHFLNAGGVPDLQTQVGALNTSMATLGTDIATAVTNAGTDAASLGVTLVSGDFTASNALMSTLNTQASADLMVSFDNTKITNLTLLRKALDAVYRQAQSGQGGLS